MTDRERMRELHNKRHAMGLCIYCSCMIDNSQYRTCSVCRAKSREKTAKHRREKKEMEAKHNEVHHVKSIPPDHKCWKCEWRRFEGDRFFCPFAEGTCAKEGTVLE